MAQLTSPSFDAILRDLFLPLTSGASLVLPEPGMDLGAHGVVSWLAREAVTVVHTVPTLAETWLSDAPPGPTGPGLRWTFFSGEPLRADLVRRWRERFSGSVVNLYGPTETTMTKCFYVVPEQLEEGDFVVPLGEAMPGAQALVVGAGGRRCGIGELGEIVIRTPYRTLATPGRPNTAPGFERNPSVEDPDDLLYFTGDLGRYRSDGALSYLGRRDAQVKVRGARVEPSEVEAFLDRHPDVVQSAVTGLRHGTETRLAAHVVRRPGSDLTVDALKRFLRGKLPEYMVPSIVAWTDALPQTASGKLDRRALAERPLELERPESESARAPRTPVEKELHSIWLALLSLDAVGIDEDFFDLGGHSLLVTRLLSRVRSAFGVALPLRTVFERPTIEGLALALTEALAESEDEAEMLRFIAELKTEPAVDDWMKET